MASPLNPNYLVPLKNSPLMKSQRVQGEYFRIVGRLIADDVDISDLLIQRQFAVLYDGGTKTKYWCE